MNSKASTDTALPDSTRMRLLEIAERLFAEQGVESAPMQQIVIESGQRNRAALNYHFGSRRDLVAAILDWRMAEVNRLRHIELDRVEADAMAMSLPHLVRAACRPLADAIRYTSWGQYYVKVLAQCLYNPALGAYDLVSDKNLSAVVRLHELLTQALPTMPAEVLATRLGWSSDVIVQSLSRWRPSQQEELGGLCPIEDMYIYIVAGISAPAAQTSGHAGSTGARANVGLARWLQAQPR